MSTIYTHAVVGLSLGRLVTARRLSFLFWILAGLLPVLPDLDVLSPYPYRHQLGHRGFTHSLAVALVIGGAAAGMTFRRLRMNFWALATFFFAITALHGVLDAFTNGGEGIAFFWPATIRRYGPWGPLPVPDVGFEFPNPRTSRAVRAELWMVWLPLAVVVGSVSLGRRLRRKVGRQAPRLVDRGAR